MLQVTLQTSYYVDKSPGVSSLKKFGSWVAEATIEKVIGRHRLHAPPTRERKKGSSIWRPTMLFAQALSAALPAFVSTASAAFVLTTSTYSIFSKLASISPHKLVGMQPCLVPCLS